MKFPKIDLDPVAQWMGRWLLPMFFYSLGTMMAVISMAQDKIVSFYSQNVFKQVQEWLVFLDQGSVVDMGRVISESGYTQLLVPAHIIFAVLFLVLAYKLTPKPK